MLKFELLPEEEPDSASISVTAPESYLLEDTYEITQYLEENLYSMGDLESFDIVVGGNKSNEASITVNFVDSEIRNKTGQELIDELRTIVKTIPGAEFNVKELSTMGPPGSGSDISVGVKGDNFNELNAVANQYLNVLESIDGVDSPTLSSKDGVKEITIEIDNNRAAYYGLNPISIASELRQRISGLTIGSYEESGDSFDITVYYDEKPIESLSEFDSIYFTNTGGQKVPFTEVASFVFLDGMAKIEHDNGDKVVTVSSNVETGYNATTIGKEFNDKIAMIPLPSGVEISTGGDFRDTQEQMVNMAISFAIAIFLVYMVLVIQFNSFQQPFVILMSVPFSLIGIIFGLIVTGNNLGFYAMMGIVALVGIAVNDAIVLVDFTNYQRSEGLSIKESVKEAVRVRFFTSICNITYNNGRYFTISTL